MEPIRSFIAIELPGQLKLALARLQDELKSGSRAPVKWVSPENTHLTLKFLGNIDSNTVDDILRAMGEAARGITPVHLGIEGLGAFPNHNRVQVIWVGVSGEVDKLLQLQKGIESSLAKLNFAPESRAFTPHLTLARVRDRTSPDERQKLGELIAGTKFEAAYAFPVEAISLMRSQLTREGAIHSQISSVALGKPLSKNAG